MAENDAETSSATMNVFYLVTLAVTLLAMVLSWRCNGRVSSVVVRALYALVAGFFGYFYLIYYFLVRYGNCVKV